MTASELLHGVHRANTEARKVKREAFVEALLSSLSVISFDLVAARAHARLWAKLASKGDNVGQHDLIIGATAISRGLDVAIRDTRSFPKFPASRSAAGKQLDSLRLTDCRAFAPPREATKNSSIEMPHLRFHAFLV